MKTKSRIFSIFVFLTTLLLVACVREVEVTREVEVQTEVTVEVEREVEVEVTVEVEAEQGEIIIGLITKTETNPFFVKMKEGAQEKADELGATLMTAAGTFDGDNESQVTAIENMVAAGAQAILITPSDTSAIVPAIEAARDEGVMVIALDTPTDPQDATDALFATDNFKAGILIGQYAAQEMAGKDAQIALLNLAPGITVGQLRRDGFVQGFGIEDGDPAIVCEEDTRGDQAMGQTAMENCLTANPDINLVYTINEPAAFGAYTALEAAGIADDVLVVSVDGGCSGVEGVNDGRIGATSQQYPLRMASLGVEAGVNYALSGRTVEGYTDTGVTLITNFPKAGVNSENGIFGVENCWGEPTSSAMADAEQAVEDANQMMADDASAGLPSRGNTDGDVIIGLITKTETNPFFVKMKEGAQEKADELGATLLTAAGTFDGDNESQVTAIENMVAAGAQGILITPSDTSAIVPAIEAARAEGVMVIALDTPTDPESATDALFATDNFQAGILIGEYARAIKGDEPAKIALLNLAPGITVGQLRRDGFVQGYGIEDGDEQIVCEEDTRGDQAMGQTAMENCLTKDPDIDLVYTINEPAAFGAYTALQAAGRADDVLIVSVDGGCAGVEGVNSGEIGATSQQYPLRMASLGVEAVHNFAQTGNRAFGYTDTGVTLITNSPQPGLASENGIFGIEECWGEPSDDAMSDAEAAVAAASGGDEEIIIGLITKTETNPFFVKMKEGAQEAADEIGATLLTAAGTFDGDNESQVTAIENMVAAGAQGILITPSDTSAIVPAIERAREEGVIVIALDTPTDPEDATDALFATDNFKAGLLIGEYAQEVMGGEPAKIALLNLAPGITVGQLRRDGFVQGYGIEDGDPQIVCEEDTRGDQAMGQTAMENCLTRDPDINVVYTINEPAAFGAYTALEAAGRADDVLIVSVDGGCAGVEGVNSGEIGATSQQYPLRMASLGVEAVAEYVNTGNAPSGYTDTGVTLITNNEIPGLDSENGIFGVENCWGEPSDDAMSMAEEAVAAAGGGMMLDGSGILIGLITKTETNPFFVKMKEGAQAKADELGAELLTAAGTFDGDNESQVTAIENMVAAGVSGILITPSDTSAIVPAIERARAEGVVVIALDTPTDPQDATDALFATDNYQAGILIGEYARAVKGDEPVKIALLNLAPGITVGQLRRDGFVAGYGIEDGDPQIVCEEDTRGDQAMGQTAMENCLTRDPEIDVVYTINEPAAFGAYTALDAAGRADDVLIVSVDGGCAGVRGVVSGEIGATSQQYPLQMASLGVEAVVDFAVNGTEYSGYTDTGVTLITDDDSVDVMAQDSEFGLANCWGE